METQFASECLKHAQEVANLYRGSSPPFCLETLANHLGVAGIRERPLDRDACIRSESGQIFIDVNCMYSLARRRLSIAHEIGHLIIDQCSAERSRQWGSDSSWIEALCNRLAGSLLVPEWALVRHFGDARTLGDWQNPIRCSAIFIAALKFRG